MDRIILPDIPLRAHVGVSDDKRAREQEIIIDVDLGLDLGPAGRDDAIHLTIDYEKVVDAVTTTVQRREYRLLEAVAEACVAEIFRVFRVSEARVRVRKPGALKAKGVPYAAVEVVRRRA
jgi:dihydroneopterin aldolase